MPIIWGGLALAAGSGIISGLAAANSPGMPKPPNQAALETAGVQEDAATLANRRAVEMAAQQGTNLSANYTKQGMTAAQLNAALTKINQQIKTAGKKADTTALKNQRDVLNSALKNIPKKPQPPQPPGKGNGQTQADYQKQQQSYQAALQKWNNGTVDVYTDKSGVYTDPNLATADFTGLGAADVARANSTKNAQNMLALQNKYGPAFLAEALKEENLANPQGKEARDREYELIQQQINEQPQRPVANLLDKQVGEQLDAGHKLTSTSQQMLDQAVTQANAARGGASGAAQDFSEPMTTGFEGQQRQQAAMGKAQGWLASGETPEDVQYRREQQNLANLGAFENGATPESQFQTLSSSQQGAAPYYQGQPLAQPNPNAGANTANAGMSAWQTSLGAAESQTNPWMAGLSSLLSAGSAGMKFAA